MLELTQLQYFVAVARAGSITKAARDLYITQSALSRVIFRLESELGTKLFDRSKGRIFLNESGKLFLEHVTAALDELDRGVQAVSQNARNRPVTIYNMLSINMLLYTFTERCQADFPTLTFDYVARNEDEGEQKLTGGEASVVLTSQTDLKGYLLLETFRETWCAMVNRKYQFQSGDISSSITLEQLSKEPIIFYGSPQDQQFITSAFAAQGLRPNLVITENAVDSGLMTNKCQGVSLVPLYNYRSVRMRVEGIPNIVLPIRDESFVRQVCLYRHRDFPKSPEEHEALQAILDHIHRETERDAAFDFAAEG